MFVPARAMTANDYYAISLQKEFDDALPKGSTTLKFDSGNSSD